MKQFTIDRSTWVRGEAEESALLNKNGERCCLGFYLQSCGVPDKAMCAVGDPETLAEKVSSSIPPEARWLLQGQIKGFQFGRNSDHCVDLISLNDRPNSSGEHREASIAKIFAIHDIQVLFVDSIPKVVCPMSITLETHQTPALDEDDHSDA